MRKTVRFQQVDKILPFHKIPLFSNEPLVSAAYFMGLA
jgi:hypothetical protein